MIIAPGESVLTQGCLRHLVRPNPQTVDIGKNRRKWISRRDETSAGAPIDGLTAILIATIRVSEWASLLASVDRLTN